MKSTINNAAAHHLEISCSGEKLCIQSGDVVLLRGASGSGKSLWLKRMAGLSTPPSGLDVSLDGLSISKAGSKQTIRMLFDRWPAVWLGQNVEEELVFGLKHRPSRTMMQEMLRQWRIADLGLDADLTGINRLQAVRLSLASMTLALPSLVLLDNPVASLAREDARIICADIGKWAEESDSIIVVACNRWQDWRSVATRIWRIDPADSMPQLEINLD